MYNNDTLQMEFKYMFCKHCGNELHKDSQFCHSCGYNIPKSIVEKSNNLKKIGSEEFKFYCPYCGTSSNHEVKYCKSCGNNIEQTVIQQHNNKLQFTKSKSEDLLLIFSLLIVSYVAYIIGRSNILITISAIGFSILYIFITQGKYIGSCLKADNNHFYRIKQMAEKLATIFDIPEPDVFIREGSELNAHTIGFNHPYSIVLTSELVESLNEEELEVVIAHEFAHAFFNHPRISTVFQPGGEKIPLVTNLSIGFWNRECEYNCDRASIWATKNPKALISALTKISIGPSFLDHIDEDKLLSQSMESKHNIFSRLGEMLSTHPYLVNRINNALNYAKIQGISYIKGGEIFCSKCGAKVMVNHSFCNSCGSNLGLLLKTSQ